MAGGRRWATKYTADQLHAMLVQDAIDGYGPNSAPTMGEGMTYINWCLVAYNKISKVRRIPLDKAFQEVEAEVLARTGRPMPL